MIALRKPTKENMTTISMITTSTTTKGTTTLSTNNKRPFEDDAGCCLHTRSLRLDSKMNAVDDDMHKTKIMHELMDVIHQRLLVLNNAEGTEQY